MISPIQANMSQPKIQFGSESEPERIITMFIGGNPFEAEEMAKHHYKGYSMEKLEDCIFPTTDYEKDPTQFPTYGFGELEIMSRALEEIAESRLDKVRPETTERLKALLTAKINPDQLEQQDKTPQEALRRYRDIIYS